MNPKIIIYALITSGVALTLNGVIGAAEWGLCVATSNVSNCTDIRKDLSTTLSGIATTAIGIAFQGQNKPPTP